MGFLMGAWDKVTIVCGNHQDCNDVEMSIQQGPFSLFYACPKYYPENRDEGERPCLNRINLIEYEAMLSHLSDMIMSDDVNKLENYKWERKGIEFEVLSCDEEHIIVKVLNKKELQKK